MGLTELGKFKAGHVCTQKVVTVTLANALMYICPICRQEFPSPEQMLFHLVHVHGGLVGRTCPLKGCHRTYVHDNLYELHIHDYHMSKGDFNRMLQKEWGPSLPWMRLNLPF